LSPARLLSGQYELSTHTLTLTFNREVEDSDAFDSLAVIASNGHLQASWMGVGGPPNTVQVGTLTQQVTITSPINTVSFGDTAFVDSVSGDPVPGVTNFPITAI
jgi:hypothetical protein